MCTAEAEMRKKITTAGLTAQIYSLQGQVVDPMVNHFRNTGDMSVSFLKPGCLGYHEI